MPLVVKYLALVTLLILGAGGWGTSAVRLLGRAGWESARDEIGAPLQVLLGVGLFLAAGGVLVALNVASFSVLVAWHIVGTLLLGARLPAAARRIGRPTPGAVVTGTATIVVGVVLAVVSLGTAIGYGFYSIYDDDPAYIYLAKRLTSTGGLVDPFNFRRLTSYGGSTLYQSLFFHVSGNSSLRGFEFTFASLVLVAVVVGTMRRRWFIPGTLVVGVAIVLGFGLGPVSNLSPACSVAALSLGTYQLLGKVRVRDDQPLLYVVIGILLSGILSLRFTNLLSVGIATLVVLIVLRGRHSIRGILIMGGTVIVCTCGWALALYRSSGTPMFPLIGGNADPSWPSGRDPLVRGVIQHARLLLQVNSAYGIGTVAVASVVIALVFLIFTRREPKRMVVLVAVGGGCLVQLAVFTYALAGLSLKGLARYEGPSTLACGLLAIDILWPRRPANDGDSRPGAVRRPVVASPLSAVRALESGTATVLLVVAMITLLVGYSPSAFANTASLYVRSAISHVRSGTQVLHGAEGFRDRYAQFRAEYTQLNAMIPPRAKVLAAVDQPALLQPSKYDFATLDVGGAVSPPPHMPFFVGASAKVRYLRRLGFQYVVAEASTQRGLYWLNYYTRFAFHLPDYHERAWAPYMIDWQSTVTTLERSDPSSVRYVGSLALIRI